MSPLKLYQCLIVLYRLLLRRDKLLCPRGMGTWKKLANSSQKRRWCQEETKGCLSEVTFVHGFYLFFFSLFWFLFPSFELFNSCSYLLKSWKQSAFVERYNLLCSLRSFDLDQSNKSKTLQFTLLQGRLISWGVVPMAVMIFQPCAFFFFIVVILFYGSDLSDWSG